MLKHLHSNVSELVLLRGRGPLGHKWVYKDKAFTPHQTDPTWDGDRLANSKAASWCREGPSDELWSCGNGLSCRNKGLPGRPPVSATGNHCLHNADLGPLKTGWCVAIGGRWGVKVVCGPVPGRVYIVCLYVQWSLGQVWTRTVCLSDYFATTLAIATSMDAEMFHTRC